MRRRSKRFSAVFAAMAVAMSLAAPSAFAEHNSAQPPGNPDQCQETGGYAADEKRPDSARADDDAGQNGLNRASENENSAVKAGACPTE